jgi:hypothetical protein
MSDFTFFCILGDCQRPQKAIRSEDDQPKYERDLYCIKQIYKYILEAEEGEVRDIKVEDFVVRNLESFNISLAALSSSACSKLEALMHQPNSHCPAYLRPGHCLTRIKEF